MKVKTTKSMIVSLAVLLAACSGDSPTAPAPGGGTGGGGGSQSVTSVALTASNTSPSVDSESRITATVTIDGAPAPDGTGVEFTTTRGTFDENQAASIIRTTQNGTATVTLSSQENGEAIVRARVGSVVREVRVNFGGAPVDPSDPSPSITSVTPSTGGPEGGDEVVITGSNFTGDVRVLFDGIAATVVSKTDNSITVITPAIDLGAAEQARDVTVTVINNLGGDERRGDSVNAFRYEREVLTPQPRSVSPSSGPNEGNTRISILGEGFQAPVRVFFGIGGGLNNPVEAEVQIVTFNEIVVLTPPASGLGAAFANQQVTIQVVNLASNTVGSLDNSFRYGPEMQITAISPSVGPGTGGTRVTIFGWGFDDPVAVTIGGLGAQPLKVSGTEVVALTSALAAPCDGTFGEVSVTNIEDGTSATSPTDFEFVGVKPSIVAIAPTSATEGGLLTVDVINPGTGVARFNLGDQTIIPTSASIVGTDLFRYSLSLPFLPDSAFDTEDCGIAGQRLIPTSFPLSFLNATTGCADDAGISILVTPTNTACVEPPAASISPSAANFGDVAVAGGTADRVITISNAGGGTVTVLASASDNPDFQVTAGTFPTSLSGGQSAQYTITYDPAVVEADTGTVTFTTSEGDLTVDVSGNGI